MSDQINDFNPSRLRFARKRRGLTIRALGEKVGLSSKAVSDFENGRAIPSEQTLSLLASKLIFPVPFFFEDSISPVESDAVSFRSLTKTTATVRDTILCAAEIAVKFSDWLDQRFETPQAEIPDLRELEPEAAARTLREMWAIGERPIQNMVHLLEAKGVRVFSLVENTLDIDACSFWRQSRPFIFLNTLKSVERGRFDAAHELGHLVLHQHGIRDGKKEIESAANRFASAFLMPEGSVKSIFKTYASLPSIIEFKRYWLVSAAAFTRRLKDLEMISEWQYHSLCRELSKLGYMKEEPQPIKEREISKLIPLLFKALKEDGITKNTIASELNIHPSEIDALIFNLYLINISKKKGSVTHGSTNQKANLRVIK